MRPKDSRRLSARLTGLVNFGSAPIETTFHWMRQQTVTIAIRARFELDMRSIRARFDSRTLSQLRFDSICARFELDSSIREKNEHVQFFSIIESNRARIELESNRILCHNYDSSSIRARFDSRILSQLRFDSICARFELDSIRELSQLRFDSICARFEHSRISHSRIESQLWQGSRIESSSNRAHIELESSSNRNCDRRGAKSRFWAQRTKIRKIMCSAITQAGDHFRNCSIVETSTKSTTPLNRNLRLDHVNCPIKWPPDHVGIRYCRSTALALKSAYDYHT